MIYRFLSLFPFSLFFLRVLVVFLFLTSPYRRDLQQTFIHNSSHLHVFLEIYNHFQGHFQPFERNKSSLRLFTFGIFTFWFINAEIFFFFILFYFCSQERKKKEYKRSARGETRLNVNDVVNTNKPSNIVYAEMVSSLLSADV